MTKFPPHLTLNSAGIELSFGLKQPQPCTEQVFHWSYRFEDGSRLEGKVKGDLDQDRHTLINLTEITADYISNDGQTVLMSWETHDFAAFEGMIDGKNTLIVASNDNFVGNSMCLIHCLSRSRAQITDGGIPYIGEAFTPQSWSFHRQSPYPFNCKESFAFNWTFSPLFPFYALSVNWPLLSPKTIYQWSFSPCIPFYPLVQALKAAN